ncbi:hypothetical protein IV203_025100 [Nitzschia inconspicua]|uniref:EGF-like domain-containing protein n=1 Tax=Nitzschia inconspicua TaxID=303405 RepID=A0A9K3LNB0_9STRA|nr:hypothetical protein IV203_025156 [Nitzschia inconspicua]KAG7365659.1 hypothetical protein IV203_025100 [Nitzschia inconspicua]
MTGTLVEMNGVKETAAVSTTEEDREDVAMILSKEQDKTDGVQISAHLTHNTYSLLFISNLKSPGFVFGMVFFVFQVSLASLAMVDLVDPGSGNVLQLPADVEPYVRAAGYLALALAVPLFTDMLDAIERFHDGYDPVVMQQAPHATKCKFLFAYILASFCPVHSFKRRRRGVFLGQTRIYNSLGLQETAVLVEEVKTPNSKGPWLRRIAFACITTGVLVGYSVIWGRQASGEYLCNRIEVQFGDATFSHLPLHSGVYSVDKGKKENDRFVYKDEVSGYSIFRYCRNMNAWVFGYFDTSDDNVDDDDYNAVCDPGNETNLPGWMLKSPTTTSFDIFDTNPSEWMVVTPQLNDLVYPVDYLLIKCLDCNSETCNSLGGQCVDDPNLSENRVCSCYEDFTGNECQFNIFTSICESITYDRRFEPFTSQGSPFSSTFEIVMNSNGDVPTLYDKPVYAFVYSDTNDPRFGLMNLVAFFGTRYYALEVHWQELLPNATVETAAADFVKEIQTLHDENGPARSFLFVSGIVYPLFTSDPVHFGTAQDKLMPTELGWYYTATDEYGYPLAIGPSIGTRLLCGQCSSEFFNCGLHGFCEFDSDESYFGSCQCLEGYVGPQCEKYDPAAIGNNETKL